GWRERVNSRRKEVSMSVASRAFKSGTEGRTIHSAGVREQRKFTRGSRAHSLHNQKQMTPSKARARAARCQARNLTRGRSGPWRSSFRLAVPNVSFAEAEPSGRGHFLLGKELHAFLALHVQVAEERFVPAVERKPSHRGRDAD